MLKPFFCAVLLLVGLCVPAAAEDPRPAGYIMAYELKGADAEKGTVVVRDGKELAPKLLMPLYDDDSVFIRDEASRITLNLAQEGNLVVSGKLMRKEIAGEMPSGDDGFDIIGQIAEILFSHDDDDSLSVLVAKGGGEMKAPLAMRGRNHVLRNSQPLRVTWTGGEGPFTVLIDEGKGGKAFAETERVIEIPMARIGGSKFAVIVTDARKRKLRIAFDLRKVAPKAPDKVKARENRGEVEAVWLAAQQNGAWRFEAVRQLRALPQDKVTADLIAALEKGWQPK
ncbi:hypothetical protein [Taklimakanibacter deserti]|uniref:hypothetical protein n=1 Tax=Taklimakanibacter deserti TaxID=2267839 RepID=UPI000E653D99